MLIMRIMRNMSPATEDPQAPEAHEVRPRSPKVDFLKLALGPILGPRGGQKWIPREISLRSHFFS